MVAAIIESDSGNLAQFVVNLPLMTRRRLPNKKNKPTDMETKGRARARVASCLALNACSPACRYLFSASSAHSPVLSAC